MTELSEAQELALVSQPKNFVVTYLLVNDWKFRDITEAFRMDENELIEILLRLDQLKIIDYRPPHRVRKLTARNFAWRKDGPVHSFFVTRFVPEFFQSAFDGVGGCIPIRGRHVVSRIAVAVQDCARTPCSPLRGAGAWRRAAAAGEARRVQRDPRGEIWEFSEFTRLRRVGAQKRRS